MLFKAVKINSLEYRHNFVYTLFFLGDYMKGTKNPINFFKTWKYRLNNKMKDFPYYGIRAYMGEFGSGKTLSSVNFCFDVLLQYPNAVFITNTSIKGVKNESYFFTGADELTKILQDVLTEKNKNGYVIFIDEMHVVLSELFATSNPVFLAYLSQLRKLGVVIIGTCQLYNKCPKVIRDYLRLSGQIIFCHKIFKGITLNRYVDMDTAIETSSLKLDYKLKHIDWFFHTVELYECYDTHAVIGQIKSLIKNSKGDVNVGLSAYN